MGPGIHTVSRHVKLTLTLTLFGLQKPLNHLHGLLSFKVDGKTFVKLASKLSVLGSLVKAWECPAATGAKGFVTKRHCLNA